ncbi:hypothetical protein PFLA_b1312 [Pseudoalteromonas flavipulchra NCIMB 2033 = ATCC BAA-314]|nr:hypothetical protein [Pseudoalteromonas flavipulchra NCIMB 2033 = ATCC BAA-314]
MLNFIANTLLVINQQDNAWRTKKPHPKVGAVVGIIQGY